MSCFGFSGGGVAIVGVGRGEGNAVGRGGVTGLLEGALLDAGVALGAGTDDAAGAGAVLAAGSALGATPLGTTGGGVAALAGAALVGAALASGAADAPAAGVRERACQPMTTANANANAPATTNAMATRLPPRAWAASVFAMKASDDEDADECASALLGCGVRGEGVTSPPLPERAACCHGP